MSSRKSWCTPGWAYSSREMQDHRGAARPSAQRLIVSFSAFRRSRSSEPHDGVPQGSTERRSSDPRQSATCVALNQRLRRRRAKYRWVWESIYDFGSRFLAAGKDPPSVPLRSLRQLRGQLQRVWIFTRDASRRISREVATRHRQKPVLHPAAFRMFSLTLQRAHFKLSHRWARCARLYWLAGWLCFGKL